MDINISNNWTVVIAVVVIWELCWKGAALWKASQNNQHVWFVLLFVLNTAGILPIIYLLTHWGTESLKRKESNETLISF